MNTPIDMRKPSPIRTVLVSLVALVISTGSVRSQASDEAFLSSFEAGREYFTLRSGTAKLIIEADKHGTEPAFTYMIFDANKPCQTLRKERAFNYAHGKGCSSSALAILLGGATFTALAHTTSVRWVDHHGIPSVEARWWAGGIAVTEIVTPTGSLTRVPQADHSEWKRSRGARFGATSPLPSGRKYVSGTIDAHQHRW